MADNTVNASQALIDDDVLDNASQEVVYDSDEELNEPKTSQVLMRMCLLYNNHVPAEQEVQPQPRMM